MYSTARNTLFLSVSTFIRISITTLVLILIARAYGAEEFGKMALSITITGILLYIADFGLNAYSTREVARDNSIIRSLTSTTLKIKFLSSAFTLLITWIIIEVLDYPSDTRLLLYLFSI